MNFRADRTRRALTLSALACCSFAGSRLSAQVRNASALPARQTGVGSTQYQAVQQRLATGWNTWDVHSVTTHVLLPSGLAIHVGMEHNTTESSNAFLRDVLIGRLAPEAEQVVPAAHSWDGSYTDLGISWKGHKWRLQSAHVGSDLVLLASPLPSASKAALPPTIVFQVDYLWNKPGAATREPGKITAHSSAGLTHIYCTCESAHASAVPMLADLPVSGPYFAADLGQPVGVSTGSPRSTTEIESILVQAAKTYTSSLPVGDPQRPIADAIETTLGWDTIYEPTKQRVISPVSRIWSVDWGGYVIFDWDTFFAATLASIGDKDLAYADTIETLNEATQEGFVPNYARGGNWKSFDRSEPPVGAITVLGLYQKYNDRWFLEDTFPALLAWNRWWNQHRNLDGYMVWGSDGKNPPGNLDDNSIGTLQGAILESGLDNSPMYDGATYNPTTHLMEFADVGLMSMYIADCEALAKIADALAHPNEAQELRSRGRAYGAKLQTLWNPEAGIFLNKDLHSGSFSKRLSPTNFYPMMAGAATADQAKQMLERHLRNPDEFWQQWVIPSIAINDPAFKDQDYWRGRIWGPMNYLVYLGLARYNDSSTRAEFAAKSYDLFQKEWKDKGHVHENYNAILGTGDDVANSDRFYHWGALLGYVEYLQQAAGSR